MANSKQARKRARTSEKARAHNASLRSMARTYIKKVRAAVATGNKEQATVAYREMTAVLDRMADKGIFHKNMAARNKSRLNAAVKAMA
ncbi:MAG: 30S ribosomal protein S20 [Gammaproteobacteria bacterium]